MMWVSPPPVAEEPARYPDGFLDEVCRGRLPAARGVGEPVRRADLEGLPEPAQRYLRFMGVVGAPRARSLRARFVGRFRRRPGGPWLRCEAWQYSTSGPATRMFRMRLSRPGFPPMTGWDTYRDGRGGLRATVLGVVRVATGSGPRFDAGEQVTWLDDALLLAPSMLLDPSVTWAVGDGADSFRVSFTDAGRTVAAEVLVDGGGAPRDVRTDDRWADLPGGGLRARWSTPVDGWRSVEGRPRFTEAHAVWHLPGGPYAYVELTPVDVGIDVTPSGEPLDGEGES
jgi:hypothetical protein